MSKGKPLDAVHIVLYPSAFEDVSDLQEGIDSFPITAALLS